MTFVYSLRNDNSAWTTASVNVGSLGSLNKRSIVFSFLYDECMVKFKEHECVTVSLAPVSMVRPMTRPYTSIP